jgi:hypothetical protein
VDEKSQNRDEETGDSHPKQDEEAKKLEGNYLLLTQHDLRSQTSRLVN